jgi:hypothetical protein
MQAIRVEQFVGSFPETRQFIPIVHFESWLGQGKLFLPSYLREVGAALAGREVRFVAVPAYKFTQLENGHDDEERLIGRIKTREELDHLNPDIFQDKVRLGVRIYHTELGYMGELRNGKGAPTPLRGNGGCYDCPSLSVEHEIYSSVYRCSRLCRVIFAEFGRNPGDKNPGLLPLSGYCRRHPGHTG